MRTTSAGNPTKTKQKPSGASAGDAVSSTDDITPRAPVRDPDPGPAKRDPGPAELPAEDPAPPRQPVEDPSPDEPPRKDPPVVPVEPGQPPPMIKDPPAPDAVGSIDPRVF
jgi:hypothetical protein